MSNQKQYKRNSKSGDYQITGENSNGINISKDGNTYLFTGNNEEQLQGLRDGTLSTDNDLLQINDPNNAASFIGMYKTGGSNINLGNPNQQSLDIKTKPQDNQNVVTPVITTTPTGSLPSKEPTPTPTPTPTLAPVTDSTTYEDIQELEFESLPDQEGFQILIDIDKGTAPEKTLVSPPIEVLPPPVNFKPSAPPNINTGTDKNLVNVDGMGRSATDFLPKDASGKILPYYNMINAANASINTYTRNVPGTENGSLGCATGVSIIVLRSFGVNVDDKVSLILGTASFYSAVRSNKKWVQINDWKTAQPGDIVNTVTVGKVHGHIGVVVDTKINDGVSYDIVSNSSSGYTGKGSDRSKAGSIQRNYSVNKWSEIANRKGVGSTYLYRYKG